MARLSKTTPFQIYSDNDSSKPNDSARNSVFDDGVNKQDDAEGQYEWTRKDDGFVTESDDERKAGQEDEAQQGDDEKNYTRTSISSLPESHYPTDQERTPMHKPYTPTYSRPSVRRMQMSSPLRKGKVGTPQSEPKGSPRTRRRAADYDLEEREPKQFPLVLLHITALPMNIPWSVHSMRETLPKHVLDNIQLLRSKLSENVRRRGILIPHPREDYELLEEKLLEALELQKPRITKCGHFRSRHSISSSVTANSESSDSGMGSSVDGSDEEHCSTCHHHLRAAGSGKRKWSIKVFAANGLMRASAWSAAWSEMERVDVEIMPWINDSLRIKLDEMNLEELAVQRVDPEADERRINELVEERLRLIEEDTERAREAEMAREIERIVINEQRQQSSHSQEDAMVSIEPPKPSEPVRPDEQSSTELPNIYRPKDIPLSILLRNYIFLLARKRWNVAVFFMMVTAVGLMLTSPSGITTRQAGLPTLAIPSSWGYGSSRDVVVSHQPVPQVPSLPEIATHGNEAQKSFEAVAETGDSEPAPFPEASVVIDEDIAQAGAQEQVADEDITSEPPNELEFATKADVVEEDTVATLPETRSEEVLEKYPVSMRSLELAMEQPTCGVAQQEAVFSEMPSLKTESESLSQCLSFPSPLSINPQCSAADAREEF